MSSIQAIIPNESCYPERTQMLNDTRQLMAEKLFWIARQSLCPLWTVCGSWMTTLPTCNQPRKEVGLTTKVASVAQTTLVSGVLIIPAIAGLIAGQTIQLAAYGLSTQNYIYIKGNGPEETDETKQLTISQLNCCVPKGEVGAWVGGTKLNATTRVDLIGNLFASSGALEADIVCAQEISDIKRGYQLAEKIKNTYAHIYMERPSWCVLKNSNGLFTASKYKIQNPRCLSFGQIPGIQLEPMVEKGCFIFEAVVKDTVIAKVAHFHLSPSDKDEDVDPKEASTRLSELRFIQEKLGENTGIPTVFIGDWNQEPNTSKRILPPEGTNFPSPTATCHTDALKAHNRDGKRSGTTHGHYRFDYIAVIGGTIKSESQVYNSLSNLIVSDHDGMKYTIRKS